MLVHTKLVTQSTVIDVDRCEENLKFCDRDDKFHYPLIPSDTASTLDYVLLWMSCEHTTYTVLLTKQTPIKRLLL